jgi:ribosomal protein S18 acetylase RimI-like enzyme
VTTIFRFAQTKDERSLAQLDRVTWSTTNSPVPLWSEDANFFATDPAGDVTVAVIDDAVVGYVKVRRSSALTSNAHVAVIGGLAVDPRVQRQGLGTALVNKAIDDATAREARFLKLHVLGTNLIARRLYERCGFHVEGVLYSEFLLNGEFVDDVIMSRNLTTPN